MYLLRSTDSSVLEVCLEVGFTSFGTFSRTFREIVGESPSAYAKRPQLGPVPTCFGMAWMRPRERGAAPELVRA